MRFLCLHGHGTNSSILEAQLSPIRALLPADWEFEFLDGEIEVPPAAGIDAVFDGPFLCYHGEPIPHDVQAAYDLVMDVVREEGPFDAVLGFSQGSAIAATILLTEAIKNPGRQPFKMGVFLSSTMPFDFDSGILRLKDKGVNGLTAIHFDNGCGDPNPEKDKFDWMADCRSKGVIEEFQARRQSYHHAQNGNVEVDVLLRYNPTTHTQRLRLPTVHVIGTNDDYADHGRDLHGMCDARYATLISHDGGHQLPRHILTVTKVADAIIRAVEQVRYQS